MLGEIPSCTIDERNRVLVGPKLDDCNSGRTKMKAVEPGVERGPEPAAQALGVKEPSLGQDYCETPLSEVARKIHVTNRRAEDVPGAGEELVCRRDVEPKEDEGNAPVVTPRASAFTAECVPHGLGVQKTRGAVELERPRVFEAKQTLERPRQGPGNSLQALELLVGDLMLDPSPVDCESPKSVFLRRDWDCEPAAQGKSVPRGHVVRVGVRQLHGPRLSALGWKADLLAARIHVCYAESGN